MNIYKFIIHISINSRIVCMFKGLKNNKINFTVYKKSFKKEFNYLIIP
jgi:hypothetical protein